MKSIFAATTAATLISGVAMADTTLFYGEPGPNRGSRAQATQAFADKINEVSGGELTIQVDWGGALFSAKSARDAISQGASDMGTIIGVYTPAEMVGYTIADLPIDNSDPWVGMRALHDVMRGSTEIQEHLASQNLVYVGTYTSTAVQLACTGDAIETLEDIKGRNVRGVGAFGKAFGDLGANLVSMSVYEAYQGLETGLIDCTQTYAYVIPALKLQEVIENYTTVDWGQIGSVGIFMNKGSYDRLSEQEQAWIMEAGDELPDVFGEIITGAEERVEALLTEQGVDMFALPEGDRAALIEAGAPYVAEWVERANGAGLPGDALLASFQEGLAKYRAERDSAGYPWAK